VRVPTEETAPPTTEEAGVFRLGQIGEDGLVEIGGEIADEGDTALTGLPDIGDLAGGEDAAI
jgi:hypothetical protein